MPPSTLNLIDSCPARYHTNWLKLLSPLCRPAMLRLCWWRQCLSLVTIQTSSQISNRNWNVRTCHKLNQRKSEWESFLHSSHNLCSELLKYIEYQKGMMRRDDVVTAIIVSKKVLSSALTRVRPYKNEIWVSESIPVRTITVRTRFYCSLISRRWAFLSLAATWRSKNIIFYILKESNFYRFL